MNLKQYTHQKRRNPAVLIISIILTFILVVVIIKKTKFTDPKPLNQAQIIITTDFQQIPDSIFPVLLTINKIIIHAFTSAVPKDSTLLMNLPKGFNSFQLIDNKYHKIASDAIYYKNEAIVFVNFISKN